MLWLGYSKQRTCEFLTLNRVSSLRSCCLWQLLNHRFPDFFLIIFWKNRKKRQTVITLKPGDLFPVIALSQWPHDKRRALLYVFLFFMYLFSSLCLCSSGECFSEVLQCQVLLRFVLEQCNALEHDMLYSVHTLVLLNYLRCMSSSQSGSSMFSFLMAWHSVQSTCCIQRRFFCTLRGV